MHEYVHLTEAHLVSGGIGCQGTARKQPNQIKTQVPGYPHAAVGPITMVTMQSPPPPHAFTS